MSVHTHSAAQSPYPAARDADGPPAFPRHVVTAVLVSHDGARWLPEALSGLLGQERPAQHLVGADTGSADDSAHLLGDALGTDRVLHLARRTGFGTAVEEAVRGAPVLTPEDLPYLKRPSGWDPVTRTWRDEAYDMPELPYGEPIQWLWLLHDDCAPAPDALAELLRVADSQPRAAVIGCKLRGWYDSRQLLEVGVSIARSGRRWTGLERREQDQGQHDQVRPVLAVSSAGMLIRRDVYEELGGFDRRLPLMRDDVDLCWRAQAAGHEVVIAPDAVLRHAEASARERRPIDCVGRSAANDKSPTRFAGRASSPHRVDKAGAVYTLLANTRGPLLPYVLLRLVVGTVLRTLAYLVGKVPGQALDELAALFGTLLRPGRLLAARRRRGRPAVRPAELRPLFPPPGATVRATVEQVAGSIGAGRDSEAPGGGRHGVVESGPGGEEADFLQIEQFARVKRLARKPGPVLFVVLLVVSLIACRSLVGGGALSGGALLPAPADVSDLWSRYTDGWHPVGVGGTDSTPPYLMVLATLATVLLGSTGLTLTLLLVCSVPLAGLTAYFASRPLVESRLLRAWGAVAYAFLPATTGALASGRLGTAVLAILLPLLARAAVAVSGWRPGQPAPTRPSWRAAWAYALLLTVTTAFTPVVWPIAVVLAVGVLVLRAVDGHRGQLRGYLLRFVAACGAPMVVLAPWSWTLLRHPDRFLDEAGMDYGGGSASALDLLTLSPGGPKAAGGMLLVGIVLAALAALSRGERQLAIRASWLVALVGLLFAGLANGSRWAGPATLVYGLALLCAGAMGAQGARVRVAAQSFGWRQPVAVLIALAAAVGPLLSAVSWMAHGAAGPVERRDPATVPAFVAEESRGRDQSRTLVLDGTAGRVDYVLVRGSGPRLGDAEVAATAGGGSRLDDVVAHLVAGSGADQTRQLGGYAVRYVLLRDTAPRQLARVLDATPGLTRLSQQDGSSLWRLDRRVPRVTVLPAGKGGDGPSGAGTPVTAGPVEAHTTIPDGGDGRVLRLADRAAPGWRATLNGTSLPRTTVDGWAQGFELPASGGRLELTYHTPLTRTGWAWAQALLVVLLVVLALPGRRRRIDDDLPEVPATASGAAAVPGQAGVAGEGRRARRLRAAAVAAGEPAAPDAGPPDDPADRPEVGERPEEEGAPSSDYPPDYPPDPPRYSAAGGGEDVGGWSPSGDPVTTAQFSTDPYTVPADGAGYGYPDPAASGVDPYAAGPGAGYPSWDGQPYPDGYRQYPAYPDAGYQAGYPEGGYPGGEPYGYPTTPPHTDGSDQQ